MNIIVTIRFIEGNRAVQIMDFSTFHVANSLKNLLAVSFTALGIAVFGIGGLPGRRPRP